MATPSCMISIRSQGLIFSVIAVLIALLCYWLTALNPVYELVLASGLIFVFGVPHGALDPIYAKVFFKFKTPFDWCVFSVGYVLAALLVAALWWFAPLAFLVIFFCISVFHFSGDLDRGTSALTQFLYGGAAIVLPALLHAIVLERLLSILVGLDSAKLLVMVLQALAWPWLLGLCLVILIDLRRHRLQSVEILSASVLALLAPPLLSFTVFFCLMHSARHVLRTQLMASLSTGKMLKEMALPLLGTLCLGAIAWLFLPSLEFDERLVQLVFVGLAALTVPHMFLVERARFFYSNLKK